ncbi:microtubule-associated protein futsch [Drosophila ficusphila]|uniref:microtubule-associated protein futsch n=1 Tax=Drosophila ficusphila TaxID=30025 RepID=UPI0007E62F36|nr:microtubule-associated protein futsch [Drosophila ficusphila]
MSLDGARLRYEDENGESVVLAAKGRTFQVGSYFNCDLILEGPQEERLICEIICDPYGRVNIYNKSSQEPIHLNDKAIHGKRPLLHGERITIRDKVYIWEFPKSSKTQDEPRTPERLSPVEQASNSCPSLKQSHRPQTDKRLTVHNFHYSINSDDEGNTSIDSRDQSSHLEEDSLNFSTPPSTETTACESPKVDLLEATQNKENTATPPGSHKKLLQLCARSDVVITSFSPRETGVKLQKSFTCVRKPVKADTVTVSTPKSVYSTPKGGVLSELNDDSCSRDLMDFGTPSTSKKAKRASSMFLIDLTTPSKLRPTPKQTPSAISVDSTDESSDASPLVIDITNSSTPPQTGASQRYKTPRRPAGTTGATPKRTPHSLIKRALLTSTKKQITANQSGTTTPGATPNKRPSLLEARRQCLTTPRRLPFHPHRRTPVHRPEERPRTKAPNTSPRRRTLHLESPRENKVSQIRKSLAAAKRSPAVDKSNKLVAKACRSLNSPKSGSPKPGSSKPSSPCPRKTFNLPQNKCSTPEKLDDSKDELSRTFTVMDDTQGKEQSGSGLVIEAVAALISGDVESDVSFQLSSEIFDKSLPLTKSTEPTSTEDKNQSTIADNNRTFELKSEQEEVLSKQDDAILDENKSKLEPCAKNDLKTVKDQQKPETPSDANLQDKERSEASETKKPDTPIIEDSICEELHANIPVETIESADESIEKAGTSQTKDEQSADANSETVENQQKSETPSNFIHQDKEKSETLPVSVEEKLEVSIAEDSICEEVHANIPHETDSVNPEKVIGEIVCEELPSNVESTNKPIEKVNTPQKKESPNVETPVIRRSLRRLSVDQRAVATTPRRSTRKSSVDASRMALTEVNKKPTRRASCSAVESQDLGTPRRKRRFSQEMSTPTRQSKRLMNTPKRNLPVDESVGDMGVILEEVGQEDEEKSAIPEDENYGNELAVDETDKVDYHGLKDLLKTPKSCSTPRFKGLREMMRTPKIPASPILGNMAELLDTSAGNTPHHKSRNITVARVDQGKTLDGVLKTPSARNIMVPNEPASAVLKSREDSVAATTEYDLNMTNTTLHLDKIFDDVPESTGANMNDTESEINVTALSTATGADPLGSSKPNESVSSEALMSCSKSAPGVVSHKDPLTSTTYKAAMQADLNLSAFTEGDSRTNSPDPNEMSGIQLLDQTSDSMFSEPLIVSNVESCDVTVDETRASGQTIQPKDNIEDRSDTDSNVGLTEPLVFSDDEDEPEDSEVTPKKPSSLGEPSIAYKLEETSALPNNKSVNEASTVNENENNSVSEVSLIEVEDTTMEDSISATKPKDNELEAEKTQEIKLENSKDEEAPAEENNQSAVADVTILESEIFALDSTTDSSAIVSNCNADEISSNVELSLSEVPAENTAEEASLDQPLPSAEIELKKTTDAETHQRVTETSPSTDLPEKIDQPVLETSRSVDYQNESKHDEVSTDTETDQSATETHSQEPMSDAAPTDTETDQLDIKASPFESDKPDELSTTAETNEPVIETSPSEEVPQEKACEVITEENTNSAVVEISPSEEHFEQLKADDEPSDSKSHHSVIETLPSEENPEEVKPNEEPTDAENDAEDSEKSTVKAVFEERKQNEVPADAETDQPNIETSHSEKNQEELKLEEDSTDNKLCIKVMETSSAEELPEKAEPNEVPIDPETEQPVLETSTSEELSEEIKSDPPLEKTTEAATDIALEKSVDQVDETDKVAEKLPILNQIEVQQTAQNESVISIEDEKPEAESLCESIPTKKETASDEEAKQKPPAITVEIEDSGDVDSSEKSIAADVDSQKEDEAPTSSDSDICERNEDELDQPEEAISNEKTETVSQDFVEDTISVETTSSPDSKAAESGQPNVSSLVDESVTYEESPVDKEKTESSNQNGRSHDKEIDMDASSIEPNLLDESSQINKSESDSISGHTSVVEKSKENAPVQEVEKESPVLESSDKKQSNDECIDLDASSSVEQFPLDENSLLDDCVTDQSKGVSSLAESSLFDAAKEESPLDKEEATKTDQNVPADENIQLDASSNDEHQTLQHQSALIDDTVPDQPEKDCISEEEDKTGVSKKSSNQNGADDEVIDLDASSTEEQIKLDEHCVVEDSATDEHKEVSIFDESSRFDKTKQVLSTDQEVVAVKQITSQNVELNTSVDTVVLSKLLSDGKGISVDPESIEEGVLQSPPVKKTPEKENSKDTSLVNTKVSTTNTLTTETSHPEIMLSVEASPSHASKLSTPYTNHEDNMSETVEEPKIDDSIAEAQESSIKEQEISSDISKTPSEVKEAPISLLEIHSLEKEEVKNGVKKQSIIELSAKNENIKQVESADELIDKSNDISCEQNQPVEQQDGKLSPQKMQPEISSTEVCEIIDLDDSSSSAQGPETDSILPQKLSAAIAEEKPSASKRSVLLTKEPQESDNLSIADVSKSSPLKESVAATEIIDLDLDNTQEEITKPSEEDKTFEKQDNEIQAKEKADSSSILVTTDIPAFEDNSGIPENKSEVNPSQEPAEITSTGLETENQEIVTLELSDLEDEISDPTKTTMMNRPSDKPAKHEDKSPEEKDAKPVKRATRKGSASSDRPAEAAGSERPKRRGRKPSAEVPEVEEHAVDNNQVGDVHAKRGRNPSVEVDEAKPKAIEKRRRGRTPSAERSEPIEQKDIEVGHQPEEVLKPILEEEKEAEVEEPTEANEEDDTNRKETEKPKRGGRKASAKESGGTSDQKERTENVLESVEEDKIPESHNDHYDQDSEKPKPDESKEEAKTVVEKKEKEASIDKPKRRARKASAKETETTSDKKEKSHDTLPVVKEDQTLHSNEEQPEISEPQEPQPSLPVQALNEEHETITETITQQHPGKPTRRARKASEDVSKVPDKKHKLEEIHSVDEQDKEAIKVVPAEKPKRRGRKPSAEEVEATPSNQHSNDAEKAKAEEALVSVQEDQPIPEEESKPPKRTRKSAEHVPNVQESTKEEPIEKPKRRGRKPSVDIDIVAQEASERPKRRGRTPAGREEPPLQVVEPEKKTRRNARKASAETVETVSTSEQEHLQQIQEAVEPQPETEPEPAPSKPQPKEEEVHKTRRRARKPTTETIEEPIKKISPEEPAEIPSHSRRRGRKATEDEPPATEEPVEPKAKLRGRASLEAEHKEGTPSVSASEVAEPPAAKTTRRGRKPSADVDATPVPAAAEKKPTARRVRKASANDDEGTPVAKKATTRRGRKEDVHVEEETKQIDLQDLPSENVSAVTVILSSPVKTSDAEELTPRRREGRNLPRKNYEEAPDDDKPHSASRRARKPAASKALANKAAEQEAPPATPVTKPPLVEVEATPENTVVLPEPTTSQRREGRNLPRKNYTEAPDEDKPTSARGRRVRHPTAKALELIVDSSPRPATPKRVKDKTVEAEEPPAKKASPEPQEASAAEDEPAPAAKGRGTRRKAEDAAPPAGKRGARGAHSETEETDPKPAKKNVRATARKAKVEPEPEEHPPAKKARGGSRAKTPVEASATNQEQEEPVKKPAARSRARGAKAAEPEPPAEEPQVEAVTSTAAPPARGGRGRKVHFEAAPEVASSEDAPKRATRSRRK